MDEVLQHILNVVLGKPNNDVLCLTVNQNHGFIEDIMSCTLEDFNNLTLVLPNATTRVKMAEQPRCSGHPHLLQALRLFAAHENITRASDWLDVTGEQFSDFWVTV